MLKVLGYEKGSLALVSPSFYTRNQAQEWVLENEFKFPNLDLRLEDELLLMAQKYYKHTGLKNCLHCEAEQALKC